MSLQKIIIALNGQIPSGNPFIGMINTLND